MNILSLLKQKRTELSTRSISQLLEQSQDFLIFELENALFDFSKNFVDRETFQALIEWAKAQKLQEHIHHLYTGYCVNESEKRPALHIALRGSHEPHLRVNGRLVSQLIETEKNKIKEFAEAIRNQTLLGFTGKPIQTIVNLGVGGSHLGIALCLEALQDYGRPNIQTYCIASLDGYYLKKLLLKLDPKTTLFIVSSKSFTTVDTLTNANTVKQWFQDKMQPSSPWQKHFVGISANKDAMDAFGILPDRQFYLWDWVGGRYSISSAIGLPVAISIGMDQFLEMLEGMRLIDRHFFETPLDQNIPAVMGMLATWYVNFWDATAHAILPYDERLQKLPAYLAQLEMESLGKSVQQDGQKVTTHTSPVVFGEVGTLAQHSFFQLLHQGTRFITADFIAVAENEDPNDIHHRLTLANCLAQSQSLALGCTDILPHKIHPGNRPSNTILVRKLSPRTLGMLIALYEHKVFVQSVLWGINAFDQWGVELGKKMAHTLLPFVGKKTTQFDVSTNRLLAYIKKS